MEKEIVLVGAGIMSATLAVFLKELMPNCKITILERLDKPAQESSNAWNNAGTGHSGFCELNYCVEQPNGTVDIKKATKVTEQFEVSKQFWSYLVTNNKIQNPQDFIHATPHISFVWGDENVAYLTKRFEAMQQNPLYQNIKFSTDKNELASWMPLVMKNRNLEIPVAATKIKIGCDVDFGALTQKMMNYLATLENVSIKYNHEVKDIQKENNLWQIEIEDSQNEDTSIKTADFVFIGAGGASLLLLEKSDIKEGEGYAGFPVSGQWLKCKNPAVIEKHAAKVYGKATVGAPPMSVPHLDTRMIDGKKELLFGPFAGFSTKFLKNGSYLDLIKSLEFENIIPLLSAGWHNLPLTKYLVKQVMQSDEERMEALREYYPDANPEDWELLEAGQRVQVIKKDEEQGGVLEFGTEVITNCEGNLAALLGASPGASTAVAIMIDVLQKCFPDAMQSAIWQDKIKEMIPSFGQKLAENPELLAQVRTKTQQVLELK